MNTEQLLALEAFSSDSFLTVNITLIKIFGLQEAVFLGNLINKYKYFNRRGMTKKENEGFFLTMESQENQTGLSSYQIRKCKKIMVDNKILKTEIKGLPAKEFYILDFEQLIDIIKESNCTPIPLKTEGIGVIETKGIYNKKEVNNIKRKDKRKNPSLKNINIQKDKTNKPSPVIIKRIVSEFNKIAPFCNIPEVKKITADRTTKLRARAKNFEIYSVRDWKEVFNHIKQSSFLCGDNDRNWTLTFDWLVNSDKNFSKVIEDNYKDKKKKTKIVGLHEEDSWDDIEPDFIIRDED